MGSTTSSMAPSLMAGVLPSGREPRKIYPNCLRNVENYVVLKLKGLSQLKLGMRDRLVLSFG